MSENFAFIGAFFPLVAHIAANTQIALSNTNQYLSCLTRNSDLLEIDQLTRANCLQKIATKVVFLSQNIKRMKTNLHIYSFTVISLLHQAITSQSRESLQCLKPLLCLQQREFTIIFVFSMFL